MYSRKPEIPSRSSFSGFDWSKLNCSGVGGLERLQSFGVQGLGKECCSSIFSRSAPLPCLDFIKQGGAVVVVIEDLG